MALEAAGQTVYDGVLPPDGTPYPFTYLGEFRQADTLNKSAIFGTVYATIHVWSDTPRNRGTVSLMLLEIKQACRQIERTPNFAWHVQNVNQRILSDSTTKTPLLHGVVEVDFSFN